ncbi:inositol monophosphatase family protein [Loigolactobacillus zhaoyuanensis]|uniref:inositol monophosphatase family protein n=1 Tax=Loigolactobacillus zhaoyuanensis TaxID=2486017 RepID=UPI000F743336|nr:inositol monophosphatase family protein [Loigolactobacillus zhaoyuanensis]
MDLLEIKAINTDVQRWLTKAATNLRQHLNTHFQVQTKSDRNDLVTNFDKQTENFLVDQIRQNFPNDKIVSEEGFGDQVQTMQGRVWFVDPIDGTLNFVKQRNDFAMMIGLYEDGRNVLGYILNVMTDELLWGGPEIGLHLNEKVQPLPLDQPLAAGLFGVNGPMFAYNHEHVRDIAFASSGARILGSAGLEFQQVILGRQVGYISRLAPWDVAAGKILAETAGLSVTTIDGDPLDMLKSQVVLVTTRRALPEVQKIRQS